MKKYIAKTNVSINIVLKNGKNRHIAFNSLTGGGSVYYTDDPDIIDAIERHYKYGTLFRTDHSYIAEKPRNKPTTIHRADAASQPVQGVSSPAPVTEAAEEISDAESASDAEVSAESEQPDMAEADSDAEAEEADNGLKTIVVSDPDAAKAYLAEHFGISRTKIKTLKAIKDAGAANGIVFEGI